MDEVSSEIMVLKRHMLRTTRIVTRRSSSGSDGSGPPLRISSTAVLLLYIDRKDPRHERANEYAFDIVLRRDLFVQSATLLELVPAKSLCPFCQYRRIETQ